MNFQIFVEWVFYGIVGGACVYGVAILSHLKTSIDNLNLQVATIIEKSNWFQKELDRLDGRVTKLEEQ